MPPAGFEPTVSEGERTQTYALDRAATGTGVITFLSKVKYTISNAVVILVYKSQQDAQVAEFIFV